MGLRLAALTAAMALPLALSLVALVATRTEGAGLGDLLQAAAWGAGLAMVLALPLAGSLGGRR